MSPHMNIENNLITLSRRATELHDEVKSSIKNIIRNEHLLITKMINSNRRTDTILNSNSTLVAVG